MTTVIEKFLNKLAPKEKILVQMLVEKIITDDLKEFDVKKLAGSNTIFRLRKGALRIIFSREHNKIIQILMISRRNEKTYRDF
jgi:mRNA-degrading endonuclease RelE of RelBE toxin-antitoxin system